MLKEAKFHQLKQQIIQIHWIDLFINSNSLFYPLVQAFRSVLFAIFPPKSRPKHDILDIIHNKQDREKVPNLVLQSDDLKISDDQKDLKDNLNDLCIE